MTSPDLLVAVTILDAAREVAPLRWSCKQPAEFGRRYTEVLVDTSAMELNLEYRHHGVVADGSDVTRGN